MTTTATTHCGEECAEGHTYTGRCEQTPMLRGRVKAIIGNGVRRPLDAVVDDVLAAVDTDPHSETARLRGEVDVLRHVARVNGGAHRIAYAAAWRLDNAVRRIAEADMLVRVREILDELDEQRDDDLPVDDDVRAALAEHLRDRCQTSGGGAVFEAPERVAQYAIECLRALWRIPATGPDADQDEAEDEPPEPAEPTTYEEAVEQHLAVLAERRRALDAVTLEWDRREAEAVRWMGRLAPPPQSGAEVDTQPIPRVDEPADSEAAA